MNNTAGYTQCIIEVVKKPRTKFMPAAKGMRLLIVYNYTNNWGTEKLVCIDESGNEYQTTLKSVRFLDEDGDTKLFQKELAMKCWIEKTHIPLIFKPISRSRNDSSYKCNVASSKLPPKHEIWITKKLVKNELGAEYDNYQLGLYQTAYIPLWYANKIGLIVKSRDT